jgi:hypothetical protein
VKSENDELNLLEEYDRAMYRLEVLEDILFESGIINKKEFREKFCEKIQRAPDEGFKSRAIQNIEKYYQD